MRPTDPGRATDLESVQGNWGGEGVWLAGLSREGWEGQNMSVKGEGVGPRDGF